MSIVLKEKRLPTCQKATIISAIFLGLVWMSSGVVADDNAIEKYRNYTPQQIANLAEEERRESVPLVYVEAASKGLVDGHELLIGQQLNSLMYHGLSDYSNAVKAFQRDLGEKPTGTPTAWQLWRLEIYAEMQTLGDVIFPDGYINWISANTASVQGTFAILGERIANPINHVEVTCYRKDDYCEARQIDLIIPDENSFSQSYHVYQHHSKTYKIKSWGEDEIYASRDLGNSCRVTAFNFNFSTGEFYEITRNGGIDCSTPRLEKPRITQIVDGREIIRNELSSVRMAAYNKLSSTYRQKIEKLIENAKQNQLSPR